MKMLSLPLLVALSLASGQVDALGLGQIEVQSRLNQPLVAEIPLLQVAPGDLERVHVRLASPEAFARVGLDRPTSLTANLQFTVDTNARGEPVVRVTTPSRVNDPFLSFLLEVDWGAGRLVREYNVLLDPPYLAPASTAQVAPATSAPAAPTPPPAVAPPTTPVAGTPAPAVEPAPVPQAPAPPTPPPPSAPAPAASVPVQQVAATQAGGTFTVAVGQTLWGIANRERPDDVGLNQMMIALLRANPDAFIDGNINLLRAGAVLRVPPRDEIQALRVAEANALVAEQASAWESRRAPVPQPAQTPAAAAPRGVRGAEPEARLAIVAPTGDSAPQGAQSGAAAGGEGTQLRVELSQAEEEIAARDAEIEELRSRLGEVEALAESQTRMIELRNQEFDDLQRQLRETREAESADPAAGGSRPWYASPFTLAGLILLVVGALAWVFARRRRDATGGGNGSPRAGSLAASIEAARSKSPPVSGPDPEADGPGEPQSSLDLDEDDVAWGAEDAESDGRWPHERVEGAGAAVGTDDAARRVESPEADDRDPGFIANGPTPAIDPAAEDFREAAVDAGPSDDGWDLEDHGVDGSGETDVESADTDNVATKLELARAYIDIGDVEGARGMLGEVVQEGSPGQRDEARSLLDSLD